MFKVNEYFDGKVKSLSFQAPEGPATVGVLAVGDYEFGTATVEVMKVVSGSFSAMLPGEDTFRDYACGESFKVPANTRFKLRVERESAYLCLFL
ncbi:MAG: pyrimidine/purine nucleoside phosphorylase [Planctomycetes bacterium]|nr:pyrimidine/purine nucleoside phosphorylase [Planctomycetota bacterium]